MDIDIDDLVRQIASEFDSAMENECTCGTMPEQLCYFCSSWSRAERNIKELINNALELNSL